MPLIIPSNTLSDSGYSISNSLRFDQASSHFLSTTFGSAGNRKTFTISTWCKLGAASVGGEYSIAGAGGTSSGNPRSYFQFEPGSLRIADNVSGSAWKRIITNAKYRDHSAWYHIMAVVDTTQSTESNRMKLFVNGTQVTSLGTEAYPSQNVDLNWNDATNFYVGAYPNNGDYDFEGYLADFYFIDGTAYTPSDFGETNDNGVWIPKDAKDDLTFGSNGFFLEFKQTGTGTNSSGMGADTSGNDNHFASNNLAATDVTTDTPTNNFATLNPLSNLNATLSEGNTQLVRNASSAVAAVATMAPTNGKWYYEFQLSAANNAAAGVVDVDKWDSTTDVYDYDDSGAVAVLIESSDNFIVDYTEATAGGTRLQNSVDLNTAKYGFAVDLDNQGFYASANGNWYTGSAFDDTDFSNATNLANDIPAGSPMAFFARGSIASASYANFGNPGGADSISSGNADANGYGNFEYAVPSGYYALCTKNLAEYG